MYDSCNIYKIVCNTTGEIYIGSTVQPLRKRLAQHKAHKNTIARSIIDRGSYDIILIENLKCDNKDELHKKEREYIEKNECINTRIPNRTVKERYERDKEDIKEYHKKYYQEYKAKNADILKSRAKAYREKNRDAINLKHRLYRARQKEPEQN